MTPAQGVGGRAKTAPVVASVVLLVLLLVLLTVGAGEATASEDVDEAGDVDEPDEPQEPDERQEPDEPEEPDEPDLLDELEAELERAQQRLEDAAAEREAAEVRRSELREEHEDAVDRVDEATDRRDEAKDELASAKRRLEQAADEYETALDRLATTEEEIAELEDHIADLGEAMDDRRDQAGDTVRELYKRGGTGESTYEAVAAQEASSALRAAGYLRSVQHDQRWVFEELGAERQVAERERFDLTELRQEQRTDADERQAGRVAAEVAVEDREQEVAAREEALASAEGERDEVEGLIADLEEELATLEELEAEAGAELVAADEAIIEERERIEREEERAEREREEERAAEREREETEAEPDEDQGERDEPEREERLRATSSNGRSGSVACPVGTPHTFVDSYGAPRSGGRSHKGTDIMAPRGTPIYAYESGVITRMSTNRLGGITLNLRGDSGKRFYYAHLDGYVDDLSTGQRVEAGEQVGYNGDTGNARGTPPHLHIEVRPSGGSNVNPYPYMRHACD